MCRPFGAVCRPLIANGQIDLATTSTEQQSLVSRSCERFASDELSMPADGDSEAAVDGLLHRSRIVSWQTQSAAAQAE